ncbi:MAG: hypothetical protein ACQEVT_13580 [Pseudomonadota bacterium]
MSATKHNNTDFHAVLNGIEVKPDLLASCTNKEAAALLKMVLSCVDGSVYARVNLS